jgi:hypothetical protein
LWGFTKLAHKQGCANLGDFHPKNANLRIFVGLQEFLHKYEMFEGSKTHSALFIKLFTGFISYLYFKENLANF